MTNAHFRPKIPLCCVELMSSWFKWLVGCCRPPPSVTRVTWEGVECSLRRTIVNRCYPCRVDQVGGHHYTCFGEHPWSTYSFAQRAGRVRFCFVVAPSCYFVGVWGFVTASTSKVKRKVKIPVLKCEGKAQDKTDLNRTKK